MGVANGSTDISLLLGLGLFVVLRLSANRMRRRYSEVLKNSKFQAVVSVVGESHSDILVLGFTATVRVLHLLKCAYLKIQQWVQNPIKCPPGGWLLSLADNVCRKSTSELVIQMVADMRVEYYDALRDGRHFRAQWVKTLHYFSMTRALTVDRLISQAVKYFIGVLHKP